MTPSGGYSTLLGGALRIDPLVASFTLLLRDPQGDSRKKALSVLGSARLRRGHGSRYGATLDQMGIAALAAKAQGPDVNS